MIIKGGSRAAPAQLAWHLQRRDTNESIEILELQSPAPNLKEAFRDWQTLVEGTRGSKGLYHANIDPAADYKMTAAQWQRAVEVLERELGLQGQPRAVVMHEKHGRTHIHVVWARTDIERMILRSDSKNYLAHERASQALEREFGHEAVPGKHAKRNREQQPDFPRAEADQAEWQQAERAGVDVATRKAEVTALKQSSDNGQTFKAALEEHGYILAKGDRRDFVIVDQDGMVHSLGRQVQGMRAAELRSFMKDVDRNSLPDVVEARDEQSRRQREQPKAKEEKRSRKDERGSETEPREALGEQIEAMRKAASAREAEEAKKWDDYHASVMESREHDLDLENKKDLERYVEVQGAEVDALKERVRRQNAGFKGYVQAVYGRINRGYGAEKAAERRRELTTLKSRQEQERREYTISLEQNKQLALDQVREQNAQQRKTAEAQARAEVDRHIREAERAHEIRTELARIEEDREKELESGYERPPPTRAR